MNNPNSLRQMHNTLKRALHIIIALLMTLGQTPAVFAKTQTIKSSSWAKISRVSGKVEIQDSQTKKWAPAKRNQLVVPGSKVKTGTGSFASIRTKERHRVNLSSKTTIALEKVSKKDTSFKVLIGRMRSFVKKLRRKARFRVKTPVAVASVRGTVFDTEVGDGDKSTFDVLKGVVGVNDIQELGQEVSVFKNQRSVVERGQRPTAPESINQDSRGFFQQRQDSGDAKQMARMEAQREIGLQNFKEHLQQDLAHEQRIAEYQDGKTVIDAFGVRVRIEEYISRPQPNQFSFITINTRENNVNVSRYDAWSAQALPAKLPRIDELFRQVGAPGSKPSNYITRQKWFVSNGFDVYREFTEGGDMVFFTETLTNGVGLWRVVFTDWYVELRGRNTPNQNFRLVSHWTPHPDFLSGADLTPGTQENIVTDGVLDIPNGYVNYESPTDGGTLIGDTRPIDAVDFNTRIVDSNIFGNATYQTSEGYDRDSVLLVDNNAFAGLSNPNKLNALLNGKKFSASHTYFDSDGTTVVTTLRVDEYNVSDDGVQLSRQDIINKGFSEEAVNFQSVSTSPDYGTSVDVIFTPRIFRKAGFK